MASPRSSLTAFDEAYARAACGLLTTRTDGTIVRVNATFCRWAGYIADELIDHRRVQDLLTVGGKVFHQTHWAPLLEIQRSVAEVKLDIRHRDGHKVPMLINAARYLHDGVDYDDFAFIVVTDRHKYEQELLAARHKAEAALEAQKAAEEALKVADRRKDEFLATLAHEIRNPLAPLRTVIEVFGRKEFDDPQVIWSRGVLERQVGQIARLVDDLLEVSRIAEGKLEIRAKPVDLRTVIRDATETSKALIDAFSHTLIVSPPDAPLMLTADATRLSQVVQNLLNNAAKYTPAGGSIWLDLYPDRDHAVIKVRDSGIGISAEHLASVFQIFSQLSPGLPHAQGGLGIGLSLVRALVERHGGTVAVQSAGTGRGAEFTVRLPLHGPFAPAGQRPARPDVELPSNQRILIVDDNEDAVTSLAMLLEMDGHTTRSASDGIAGLSLIGEFAPQTVILDIGLPGMDGFEVASRIRGQTGRSDILLIALTGWAKPTDRENGLSVGFDFFLTKPVDYEQLVSILGRRGE